MKINSPPQLPEAIKSVFAKAEVQTCIVHLIRYSMQFASWKERKAISKALEPIYQAETAELAASGLRSSTKGRGVKNTRASLKPGGENGNR